MFFSSRLIFRQFVLTGLLVTLAVACTEKQPQEAAQEAPPASANEAPPAAAQELPPAGSLQAALVGSWEQNAIRMEGIAPISKQMTYTFYPDGALEIQSPSLGNAGATRTRYSLHDSVLRFESVEARILRISRDSLVLLQRSNNLRVYFHWARK